MPEQPQEKARPHPSRRVQPRAIARPSSRQAFAELWTTSNFTFLTGASHPEELVDRAAALGLSGLAVTDRNSLAGVVRAHVAAREIGLPLMIGSCVDFDVGVSVGPTQTPMRASCILLATDVASYARLCRLLTIGRRRAPKGQCHLTLHDLLEHQEGLLALLVPPAVVGHEFLEVIRVFRATFDDDRLSLIAVAGGHDDDRACLDRLMTLAAYSDVPLVASNEVHYHIPARRALQDVVTCIRHGCTIHGAGRRLHPHGERYLKSSEEMERLFHACPTAVRRSQVIAERASGFSLDELRYQYPDEICPNGIPPMQYLKRLTWHGLQSRYPSGSPEKVRRQIEHEFSLIDELGYAPYFLTVHDLVMFARQHNILCQGRGAAANSAVCYALGVTAVDPGRINLLFERFISRERNEPPDIDIDFEHERREEVIQYIYAKYGRDRAALTAEVITYRGRSAVREVGKVLGLSRDCVDQLAGNTDWWMDNVSGGERVRDLGLDPTEPTLRRVIELSNEIRGFPRHLSQHVGGFVITRGPLCEMVPVENAAMADRTVIEWDKDDIDAMGMLKVDVLGLGMLTCIRKTIDLINEHRSDDEHLEFHTIPAEDPEVYDMICAADTIGVFQIESRAQMSMLPRLRPRCFYDLVIEVAIVRPGPIQGDMVHPYLRRRDGKEEVVYPNEDVREVLGKTLGVPLFQEQAMALAIVAAGFTAGEADQLRRAMAAWKRKGDLINKFEQKFITGMLERGFQRTFAEQCFRQIRGFSEYGFPESHAASFALIVYVSAWLKKHHPSAFAAGLLNSQPMGFYAPAQIVRDAQEHGVQIMDIDVNQSLWDCGLQEAVTASDDVAAIESNAGGSIERRHGYPDVALGLRLGLRLVKGLREDDGRAIAGAVRRRGPFDSIQTLWRESEVSVSTLKRLARADAFQSMGIDRQAAIWHTRTLNDDPLPMFDHLRPPAVEPEPDLPTIPVVKQVMHDYAATHLSLKAHPVSFIRPVLAESDAIEARELVDEAVWPHGSSASVAGIALVRQRPATASGIVFITLEDETGIANLIIRPPVFERYRRAAKHGIILLARGRVERQGEVVHLLVRSIESMDHHMTDLTARSRDFR